MCEVYGGQCECIDQSDGFSRVTGRRCDLCPFTTFLTDSGCAGIYTITHIFINPSLPALSECECGDPSESCDVGSGQCVCPPLVTGRTCDSCMENTFGDPGEGCFPCGCDDVGTDSCNGTSGECV